MAVKGAITLGAVILIVQSAEKIIWPIQSFSEALPKILSIKSILKRIDETLKNKTEYHETLDFSGFQSAINLKNVKFGYEDTLVLEDVSVDFEKGKKYLIVGPSGGGKSTILKLLRKYFNPESGDILIDNVPLKDIKKEQYFAHIANIEQNVFLFEDTVRNNLTLYKEYSHEDINSAIERSGLTDFIANLPNGLETMIYDNGKNISGGERSRLAIARGLINKSDIIFLDEAFANLDSEKAKAIEKSLLALSDVTIINVSHIVFKEHQHLYDNVYVVKNKMATRLLTKSA
jgi:ATP-binding cassette subfamily C protein